jgi:hypothetical protein
MRCDRAGCLTEASRGSITDQEQKVEGSERCRYASAHDGKFVAASEQQLESFSLYPPRYPGDQFPESFIPTNPLQVRIVFEQGLVFVSQGN